MSYLKRLLRRLFSRNTLVLLAVVLAGLAVWFIGPLLGFGDYRPLDEVGARIAVIVVLLALLLFWLMRWPAGPIVVAVVALLLWHLGPLLALGGEHPLAPVWIRVLLVSALVACYAIYGLYRLWKAVRSDDALLQRLLNPFSRRTAPLPTQVARDELRAVHAALARALDKLRRMRSGASVWRRLFEKERYLYELPWYMVIGSPGAGKTTLVMNSGLEFPDAGQMGASSIRERVETANCEWWFTNEAILIDTAGRYTLQQAAGDSNHARPETEGINSAEWLGFLEMLRKHRPRAPINGALLVVSVEELLNRSQAERTALAAAMRSRLGELRATLGVRFPVYVLVTKLDLLPGFEEYFQSLTAEGRAQVLGFTLAYRKDGEPDDTQRVRERCREAAQQLASRLEAGLNARLQEEYEADRRRRLYVLPDEFRCLGSQLLELVGLVFLDSRYDDTQLGSMLRGVYFTSAAQTHEVIPADRTTLLQRLRRRLGGLAGDATAAAAVASSPTAWQGFFLRTLLRQVILAEGHLVRPNLNWEWRFRTLRVAAHLLSIALAAWLIGALIVSFGNNRAYLSATTDKTGVLEEQVGSFRKLAQPGALAAVLSASRELPDYGDLDLDSPGGSYRYGLYAAPAVVDASSATYANLLNQMLLPQVTRRVETVLDEQLRAGDADGVYRTLSIYLMLDDGRHYDAKAINAWVLDDWEHAGTGVQTGASIGASMGVSMGERDALARHLDALFADGVPVKPGTPLDAELIREARDFLDRNPVVGRLYERAVASMQKDAPENVTLASAAGPQAAAVLTLVSGSKLERGIPGLYTYDGYHDVFNQRLPAFVAQAHTRDAWVMGREEPTSKLPRAAGGRLPGFERDRLADEVRRQYLTDYGNYWQQFLDDIRPANGSRGGGLALDLQTLRTLSAPDSPLVRVVQTAVHETSLTVVEEADTPSATDPAMAALGRRSRAVRAASAVLGAAAKVEQFDQLKLEKELVDNRFAALRQVVTGKADTGRGPALSGGAMVGGSRLRLEEIIGLLNEQYSRLSLAGNMLAINGMPPPDDIGSRLQMEAMRLPAPFPALLGGIAAKSMQKVDQGVGSLLAMQVDSSVGTQCRRALDGRYPFAASTKEVDLDDFNRLFAPGGVLDDFFQKTLADHVDTNLRPWRYRPIIPGMPAPQGPSLQPFERAAAIRQAFFRDGSARMSWNLGIRVASMDPDITELLLDIDGQSMRYVHGPVRVFQVSWPGPRGGSMASMTANPPLRTDTASSLFEGPWALFRLIDAGRASRTAAGRPSVDFDFDGRHVVLELLSGAQADAYASGLLKGFRCPGSAGTARSRGEASRGAKHNSGQ